MQEKVRFFVGVFCFPLFCFFCFLFSFFRFFFVSKVVFVFCCCFLCFCCCFVVCFLLFCVDEEQPNPPTPPPRLETARATYWLRALCWIMAFHAGGVSCTMLVISTQPHLSRGSLSVFLYDGAVCVCDLPLQVEDFELIPFVVCHQLVDLSA